jgi:hypothetical protein
MEGRVLGCTDGSLEGNKEGNWVVDESGALEVEGSLLDEMVGKKLGMSDGSTEGFVLGDELGSLLGNVDGIPDGRKVGL